VDDTQRRAVRAGHMLGMTVLQIAASAGCDQGSVRVYLAWWREHGRPMDDEPPKAMALGMTYVVTIACADVLDKSCLDECPVNCLYEGDNMMFIKPDECIDCGACEPTCPSEAIYFAPDLPEDLKKYEKINADHFTSP
jgi:NAD-dependent dihydropyrimidine dehydrogenase PreA subunit